MKNTKKTGKKSENDFLDTEDIHKALDEMESGGKFETEEEDEKPIKKAKKSPKIEQEEDEDEGTNAEVEDENGEDEDEELEEKPVKAKKKKGIIKKGKKLHKAEPEETEESEEVEKAIDVSPVLRQFSDQLGQIDRRNRKFNKGMVTVLRGLIGQVEAQQAQLGKISGTPVNGGRRSAASARPAERFAKGEESNSMQPNGKNILNQRVHKAQILEILDELAFNGEKMDENIAKAMTSYEVNTPLPQAIIERVKKERGVQIV